jgi:hypothetical protein
MYERYIQQNIIDALLDTPVVFIRGARQVGKSTLVQKLAQEHYPARYITLDNAAVLAAATSDPTGFIFNLEKPVIIDEAQRVPELFLAIKEDVDNNKTPGRYLLTGSANVLTLPKVADSLAGRIEIITLWPLSQDEIKGRKNNFIESLFSNEIEPVLYSETKPEQIFEIIVGGGYPEPLQRKSFKRKTAWFDSYITTMIERDIRDLANIQDLAAIPKLLRLLASRTASLLNQSEISRSAGIPNTSLIRYRTLLETTYLIHMLPPWSFNIGKRLVKSPKVYFVDTGLASYLLGLGERHLQTDHDIAGKLFENFVVMELLKKASWSKITAKLFHFRSQTGQEIDVILEDTRGRIIGIEIKLSSTVSPKHFKGTRMLQEYLGDRFLKGIVLYTGSELVPFGDNLFAVPLSTLYLSK